MSGSATSTASASPSGSACPVPKSTLSGRMNDASFSWCSGTGDSSVEIFSYGDDSTFQPDFSDIGTDSYTTFDASIPSDRVLRPRVPNLEWLGSGAVPTDRKKGCQADPDNCDNGGSGNCVLTTTDFNFDQSDMPTADASRKRFRVIRANTTYRFLPGESMLARELVPRQSYQLVFNCDEMNPSSLPDVCNNMCYGMNCNKVVGPFMRETDKQKCKNNRKANECAKSVPNRCSAKYTGQDKVPGKANSVKMSCDEFPFASTDVASKPGIKTATRCVEAAQNSKQGGRLGAFYRWELAANAQFTIAFDYGVGNFLSPGPKGPQENPFSAATTKMPYCLPKSATDKEHQMSSLQIAAVHQGRGVEHPHLNVRAPQAIPSLQAPGEPMELRAACDLSNAGKGRWERRIAIYELYFHIVRQAAVIPASTATTSHPRLVACPDQRGRSLNTGEGGAVYRSSLLFLFALTILVCAPHHGHRLRYPAYRVTTPAAILHLVIGLSLLPLDAIPIAFAQPAQYPFFLAPYPSKPSSPITHVLLVADTLAPSPPHPRAPGGQLRGSDLASSLFYRSISVRDSHTLAIPARTAHLLYALKADPRPVLAMRFKSRVHLRVLMSSSNPCALQILAPVHVQGHATWFELYVSDADYAAN
ncbi:hypothetical protein C8R44DRAFT_865042 [Mycena epipterygia]|nr:hypothetical protein C8R44DRAFT_865042 [Mycena epipterygia]